MKKRLDILITEKGLASSRSRAQALIMEGAVFVDGQREDKAGSSFEENVHIEVKKDTIPFVSRGGLKIQKALDEFDIDISGMKVMDVGASTGGFTDCMLKRGASLVYSIDVGYGQFDYGLRCDERVVVMERTNIRNIEAGSLVPVPEFASIDVSFISLKLVIPKVKELLVPKAGVVALIKPQFEAGRENVGKNGVVRDKSVHIKVIEDVVSFAEELGYSVLGLSYSPIKGPKGNIEFLLYIKESDCKTIMQQDIIKEVVQKAHEGLRDPK